MRITLAQIAAFFWTAKLGTVRAAAERLHITQPSLSLRMSELERTLGNRLFVREGRNLGLSTYGRALFPRAEALIAMATEIEGHGGARGGDAPQVIRLGVVDFFAMTLLGALLDEMHATHPNLAFELHVGFSQVLGVMLEERRLDMAVLTNPAPAQHLRQQPLGRILLAWMVSPDCELAEATLSPADLRDLTIYTNPAPSLLHDSVHRWFQAGGIAPAQVNVCNTLAVMAQLATRRQGATLLPRAMHGFDQWAAKLRLVHVAPEPEPHHMFAVAPEPIVTTSGVLAVIETARRLVRASAHFA